MKPIKIKKRYKIILGIISILVILLFAVPRVSRWYVVKHSHELIGRELEIKKIRFNYLTGTLRIYEAKLYESDTKTVFLSFNQLKINLEYLPLLKNEIFVKYITLDDPFVEVLQKSDKFNLMILQRAIQWWSLRILFLQSRQNTSLTILRSIAVMLNIPIFF